MIYIGIIILNYKSENETLRIYEELNQQAQTDHTLEIIVVDNSLSQHSVDRLKKKIPINKLIINKKNSGYSGGNNLGIKFLGIYNYDYFLIVNPDIHLTENLIVKLVNSMESNREIGAIAPRICDWERKNLIYSDGGIVHLSKQLPIKHKNSGKEVTQVERKLDKSIDYANGSCILIRSKTLHDIGLLNELFFMYFEETEWCSRAKENGWTVAINSHVTVYHKSSTKGSLYHYYMARNRIIFAKYKGIPVQKIITQQIKGAIYKIFRSGQNSKIGYRILLGTLNGWFSRYKFVESVHNKST